VVVVVQMHVDKGESPKNVRWCVNTLELCAWVASVKASLWLAQTTRHWASDQAQDHVVVTASASAHARVCVVGVRRRGGKHELRGHCCASKKDTLGVGGVV
jgi:hypothetical protein